MIKLNLHAVTNMATFCKGKEFLVSKTSDNLFMDYLTQQITCWTQHTQTDNIQINKDLNKVSIIILGPLSWIVRQ